MPRKKWSHIRDAKLSPEARERAARLTEAMLKPMATASMGRDPYVCVPVELVDRALTRLSGILGDARALMEGDLKIAPSTHGAKIHDIAKSLLTDFEAMRARADRNAARGRPSAHQRNAGESNR